jgi:hypothetical protein
MRFLLDLILPCDRSYSVSPGQNHDRHTQKSDSDKSHWALTERFPGPAARIMVLQSREALC